MRAVIILVTFAANFARSLFELIPCGWGIRMRRFGFYKNKFGTDRWMDWNWKKNKVGHTTEEEGSEMSVRESAKSKPSKEMYKRKWGTFENWV